MKTRFLSFGLLIIAAFILTPFFLQSQTIELSQNSSNWNMSGYIDSTWMHYDDVENYDSWGFMISGELYDVMAKWDPADLTNYETWVITKVKFIVTHDQPILKVKVWEGADGTEIYSQDVPNYAINDWTEVTLTTPVAFDHNNVLMVGYEVDMTMTELGGAVTATDDGPPIVGYGNLYRWNGGWYSDFNNHNLRVQIQNEFGAVFTADEDSICANEVVNFTDNSIGSVTSWNWTFEGGTPSTSTDQNPTVTYNSLGTFDVTLVISDGTNTDTTLVQDMITVLDDPSTPATPSGDATLCAGGTTNYTIPSVAAAESYTWTVSPSNAGTITGSDTIGTFSADPTYTGSYSIMVKASNRCSTSPWSDSLVCLMELLPQIFQLSQSAGYCEGGQGIEVKLDGSETGVNYELFLDGVSTGTIVPGTGDTISFGFQTEVGIYTATGFTSECESQMMGNTYIFLIDMPEQGNTPVGNTDVCAGSTEDYIIDEISDADSVLWILDPSEAGTIIGSGLEVSVEWATDFSGIANLSTQGYNECGTGDVSDPLEITVTEAPAPEVSGEDLVCVDQESEYTTTDNAGSTYEWIVNGGEITAGAGTYSINVLWGATAGTGSIQVTETSSNDCDGTSEVFEVVIDECTGIADAMDSGIKISPNPVTGNYITVNKEVEEEVNIQILDIRGSMIHQQILSNSSTNVDVSMLDKGMFFMKAIYNNGEVSILKFIRN